MSPFVLLQEIYIDDPWKIMVCCILLNQTTRKQVDKVRDTLFKRWPSPEAMAIANEDELIEVIRSLGFYNRRAKTLIKFSREWTEKDWKTPRELYGIGQYAHDSWNIFVEHKFIKNPTDHILKAYSMWISENNISHIL